MLHSLLQRGLQDRRPLKFPVLEPVWWKARPGSEVIGGETLSVLNPLMAGRLGLGQSPAARWGFFFISKTTYVCLWEGAQIPCLLPLLPAPRPSCSLGLDGVKVSASISTIFPRGHVNKYACI